MSGAFAAALATALGRPVEAEPEAAVRGGCINDCFRWQTAAGPVFVKRCALDRSWLLETEQDGLERLRAAGAIRAPAALAAGGAGDEAFLVLEWLDLQPADDAADANLGAALARLHETHGPSFGLERDNAIGATAQPNGRGENWPGFWRERRLGFQLELAARNGYTGRLQNRGRRLLENVGAFFKEYRPLPSLLHGDLWNGNRATLVDGTPVVFDPAVYYGDPEADIAMTRLFGGFGPEFYAAYAAVRPPDAGAATRHDLYNLYHVLNHLNLFGGSYRGQAENMIDRLLAAVGH
ncbi:MAG: fructosamine kinase family protein [Steroidobacteraceae bacterium]